VRVSLDGQVLADSCSTIALFETNLPTRWYIPREDVLAKLEPSDRVSGCPYKGHAAYYSVRLDSGEIAEDMIWCYPEPLEEVGRIAGLLCFFNERVDLELDGKLEERPASPWSHGGGSRAQNAPPAQTRG
jgi:uncharacterized protein (DUF427 family)